MTNIEMAFPQLFAEREALIELRAENGGAVITTARHLFTWLDSQSGRDERDAIITLVRLLSGAGSPDPSAALILDIARTLHPLAADGESFDTSLLWGIDSGWANG